MLSDELMKVRPPIETEAAKEAAAALRAEIEKELRNLKQCAYKTYECSQLTLDGYDYCLRHILQDKNAPYKQCAYTFTSGKRCYLPAPKDKKDEGWYSRYCKEHALNTHLFASKKRDPPPLPHTPEYLLGAVSHYICKPQNNSLSYTSQPEEVTSSSDNPESVITGSYDPSSEIDANAVMTSRSSILGRCSESESDVEPTTYNSVWHDDHAESSDEDSVDSEQEDILKHANVYSAEEITLIARDKLMRLHNLYVEQYTYLHHELKERRRQYLHALKREKETYCSIVNQVHGTPKEQRMYKKLKAYNSYHRKHGDDAICSKRSYERRVKLTEGLAHKPPTFPKCIYTEGGVKCGERALPTARHCRKHILEDPNQILFRACGKMNGDIECTTAVETIFDNSMCRLHMDIPPIRCYSQIRKDSESDFEDSLEIKPITQEEDIKMDLNDLSSFSQNVTINETSQDVTTTENSIVTTTENSFVTTNQSSVLTTNKNISNIPEEIKMEVVEETHLDELPYSSLHEINKLEPEPCTEDKILNKSIYEDEEEGEVFIGFPSEANKLPLFSNKTLLDVEEENKELIMEGEEVLQIKKEKPLEESPQVEQTD